MMAEFLSIRCDRCGGNTAKYDRARIRWAAQPTRLDPYDLCRECGEWLQGQLHRAPKATNLPNNVRPVSQP